jgi:hypothetical protein
MSARSSKATRGTPVQPALPTAPSFPLCSFNLWDKEDAIIARALQNGDPRFGGHFSQLLVAQRKRTPDRTIDAQLVGGEIQLRGREMIAYVEQLHRSEKRVKLIEGSLQIGRLLLSNDQAHRRGLTSFRDLASGGVLLGILHVFSLKYISFPTTADFDRGQHGPSPIGALTLGIICS